MLVPHVPLRPGSCSLPYAMYAFWQEILLKIEHFYPALAKVLDSRALLCGMAEVCNLFD